MGRPSAHQTNFKNKFGKEKTRKITYRSYLLGHRTFDDEAWYAPTGGTGGSHAPFYISVVELHDAFNADVAALGALLFQLAEFFIAFGRQVNREGDN